MKLSVFTGEGQRIGGRTACDAVMDLIAREPVDVAVLLRGIMGFGAKHTLRTDRALSMSEDLPMVTLCVGPAGVIERMAEDLVAVLPGGLMLRERVLLVDPAHAPVPGHARTKLTMYVDRNAIGITAQLREAGLDGAVVFAGVDGLLHGDRRRARLFGRGRRAPAMIVSVGAAAAVQDALERIDHHEAVTTLERVHVVDADPAESTPSPPADETPGPRLWRRVTVIAGEVDLHRGMPLHDALITELRAAGADGATVLRGGWGFTHGGAPHGDRLWALRRRTPTLLTFVDRPERIARWWPIVQRVTREGGVVSCETVPAVHVLGSGGTDHAA